MKINYGYGTTYIESSKDHKKYFLTTESEYRTPKVSTSCFHFGKQKIRIRKQYDIILDLLSKRHLVDHTEVDRQGLYECSTLEKFKVLCGKANGIRHRTIHNLGGD